MVCPKTHNRRHSSSVKAVGDLPKFSEKEIKEIENFQQRLVQLGFLAKDSFKKGVFDDSTKKATQSFQKAFKTENQDGTLDQETLNKAEEAIKDKSIQPGIFVYKDEYGRGEYDSWGSEGFIPSCKTGITNNHVTEISRDDNEPTALVTKNKNGQFVAFPNQTLIPAPDSSEESWQPDLTLISTEENNKSNIANCKWLTNDEISEFIMNREPIFISTYRDDNDLSKNQTEWPTTLPTIGTNKALPVGDFDIFSSKATVVKVYPLNLKIEGTFESSTVSASGNPQTIFTLIPPSKDGKPNMNIVGGSSGSPSYIVKDGKKQILGVHKASIPDWEFFTQRFIKGNLYDNRFLEVLKKEKENPKALTDNEKDLIKQKDRASKILYYRDNTTRDDDLWISNLLFEGQIKSSRDFPSDYLALVELMDNYSKQIVSEIKILSKKYPDDFEKTLPILNNSKLTYTEKWKELMKIGCEIRMTDPIAEETVNSILAHEEVREVESKFKNNFEEYKNKLENFFKNSLAGLGL